MIQTKFGKMNQAMIDFLVHEYGFSAYKALFF